MPSATLLIHLKSALSKSGKYKFKGFADARPFCLLKANASKSANSECIQVAVHAHVAKPFRKGYD